MLSRIGVLLLAAVCAYPQEILVRPEVQAGDEFHLRLTRTREDARRPQFNATSQTPIDIRFTRAGSEGFVLIWKFGKTEIDNPELMKNPTVAAFAESVVDLQFEVKLSPDGTFDGLLNANEILAAMEEFISSLLEVVGKAIDDPADQQKLEAALRSMFTPEVLVNSATKEIQMFFGLHGVALDPGQPVEVEDVRPSGMGDADIPTVERLSLESVTETSAHITTSTKYDPAALRKFTLNTLERAAGEPFTDAQKAQIPPLEMSDAGDYTYDRRTGLMSAMKVTRRVGQDGKVVKLDEWTFELRPSSE